MNDIDIQKKLLTSKRIASSQYKVTYCHRVSVHVHKNHTIAKIDVYRNSYKSKLKIYTKHIVWKSWSSDKYDTNMTTNETV